MHSPSELPWAYDAFGLNPHSGLELPGLAPTEPSSPEPSIRLGGVEAGAGKSTLAVALHQAGWSLLADDLVVLSLSEGGPPLAHPESTEVRLWSDAVGLLEVPESDVAPISGRAGNRRVRLPHPVERDPLPLHAMVELVSTGRGAPQPVRGAEKVGVLLGNTCRARVRQGLGGRLGQLDRVSRLAPLVPNFQLCRAPASAEVPRLAERLQDFLGEAHAPSVW